MTINVVYDTAGAHFIPGGISVHIRELEARLHSSGVDSDLLVHSSDLPPWLMPGERKGFARRARVLGWDTYYTQLILPARVRSAGARLLHATGGRLPLRAGVPMVVTIYDAIPLLFPQLFRFQDRLLLRFYLHLAGRRADHILTISEWSRSDIRRLLNIAPERISVIYSGAGPHFTPVARLSVQQTLDRLGIRRPYILSVSNVEPRKNLPRVLEAFARLHRSGAVQHTLVLAGKHIGSLANTTLEAVRRLRIEEHVQFTGFVADADLPALYSGADLFVYPSLYEGFGIPPLEAMACGCPVVTSNSSSLPEVVGDAALVVEPTDVQAITEAMARLIDEPQLKEMLRDRGLARARLFTWERCAQHTLAAYRLVLAG